jgi:hypothetical protein
MSSSVNAAKRLAASAKQTKVRFPKVLDEKQILQQCLAILMTFRNEENEDEFDEEAALEKLIENYGVEEVVNKKSEAKGKRKVKSTVDANENERVDEPSEPSFDDIESKAEESKSTIKKAKLSETVKVESNRPFAEAIKGCIVENSDLNKNDIFLMKKWRPYILRTVIPEREVVL